MKPFSNFLHRTPWWVLLGGGLVLFIALAVFVVPFRVLHLEHSGATPEENRAIKREIDLSFTEAGIDIGRSVVREMRNRTRDPARREELDQALQQIDEARETVREAGKEASLAREEAAMSAAAALKAASRSIELAREQAGQALKDAGVETQVQEQLDRSLAAAQEAQEKALKAEQNAPKAPAGPAPPVPPQAGVASPEAPGAIPPVPPARKRHFSFKRHANDKGTFDIQIDGLDKLEPNLPPVAPLPPEVRQNIREKVKGDMYRIGVGAGLVLLFIPLFILAIVSKFFIDRSRASQKMAEQERREAEYHRMSQQVTEAKLSALQAQVEPHFLYNTLASVQALTEVDPGQANAMTGHLIQYLRNALPKMRESVSTVGQEIELVRAYLNILQMRMGKRLAFEIDVPPELLEAPFPPLMLPSLVENAIKHGLEPQREGGKVTITAAAAGGSVRMVVADTGRGFSEAPGQGVGLSNIRERLAALYGNAAKLTLEANEPQGVRATIEVPRNPVRHPVSGTAAAAWAGATGAPMPPPPPRPATAAARTLAAMGTAERAWRKSLSFAFVVLVVVAAVAAGLAVVGVTTGMLPVNIGDTQVEGATGALIGTAGIAIGFCVVVLALAIVLAVVYGLGFIFVGLALFIPLAILVSLFPVLAPFILFGLIVWWAIRRSKQRAPAPNVVAAAAPSPPPPAAP